MGIKIPEYLKRQYQYSYLLPDPVGEVVRELIERIATLEYQLTEAREQLLDKQKLYTEALLREDALEAKQEKNDESS